MWVSRSYLKTIDQSMMSNGPYEIFIIFDTNPTDTSVELLSIHYVENVWWLSFFSPFLIELQDTTRRMLDRGKMSLTVYGPVVCADVIGPGQHRMRLFIYCISV